MRYLTVLLALLLSVSGTFLSNAQAQVDIGVSIGSEGLRSFYMAIGDYYRVPHRDVIVIRDRHIPDAEIPVVLFLSRHAKVDPSVIVRMRLDGRSWIDITLHFGLSPEIYYVQVREVKGPPYGKAYGHYKHKHKKDWKHIRLDDDDVVNMVNLRFISEHHHYSPDEVVRMREGGRNFIVINEDIRKSRGEGRGKGEYGDGDRKHDKGDKKEKHGKGHKD